MKITPLEYKALQVVAGLLDRFDPECAVEVRKKLDTISDHYKPITITREMVQALRNQTGEGIMACNKALRHSNGDMDKAKEFLRMSGTLCI